MACKCGDYDSITSKGNAGFTAVFTMPSPLVLTKYPPLVVGGPCCYQASGYLNVAWTYSQVNHWYYCDGIPGSNGSVCEYTQYKTGTQLTKFCLMAQCGPNPLTGEIGWLWYLTTCSFAVTEIDTIDLDPPPPAPLDCDGDPPLGLQVGLVAGACLYTWWTPLLAPNLCNSSNAVGLGLCLQPHARCGPIEPGTDPLGIQYGCMYTMQQMAMTYGPCALSTMTINASWPPPPCARDTAQADTWGMLCNPSGLPLAGACDGHIDHSSDCCDVVLNHAWTFPNIY
jgi:hypothetical protein